MIDLYYIEDDANIASIIKEYLEQNPEILAEVETLVREKLAES